MSPGNVYTKPAQKWYRYSSRDIVVREMPHFNYQSRGRIGPYHFWGISPRNSTLFTRLFLAGRRMQAGHETSNLHMEYQSGYVIGRLGILSLGLLSLACRNCMDSRDGLLLSMQ